jgi:3-phosphoshikimate 1-carboxyvinyltransferase
MHVVMSTQLSASAGFVSSSSFTGTSALSHRKSLCGARVPNVSITTIGPPPRATRSAPIMESGSDGKVNYTYDPAEVAALKKGFTAIYLSPISYFCGEINLPGSKSLSNRVLLLAALCEGETRVGNLLESDDIRFMKDALDALGVAYATADGITTVVGCGGTFPISSANLFLGNAGTAMRPLTAALCTPRAEGTYVLDGVPRMRERPIGDLVDGLVQLGANVECSDTGCPPVTIQNTTAGLPGGVTKVSGKISSQYLSALLMAAPFAVNDVEIQIIDTLVSVPYVTMTVNLMKRFGVTVDVNAEKTVFRIAAGQRYVSPGEILVEGDASSASYFLAGGAIIGGPVTIHGCGKDSIQGDVEFATVLEAMGATVEWGPTSITVSRPKDKPLKGIDVSCQDIPDAAMTLAVVALFAEGPTAIRDVYNWRVKETERMKAIVAELTKLGAKVEEGRDYCIITPPERINKDVFIDTYDDHRMAMAFSLAACSGIAVSIRDPACTAKTFPTYFDELQRMASDEEDLIRRLQTGEGF